MKDALLNALSYYVIYTFQEKLILNITIESYNAIANELHGRYDDVDLSVDDIKSIWYDAIDEILYGSGGILGDMQTDVSLAMITTASDMFRTKIDELVID